MEKQLKLKNTEKSKEITEEAKVETDEAKAIDCFFGTNWCDGAYDTMIDASALIIITEWNEFRALDLVRIKETLREPTIIDLRNIYEPEEMRTAGFNYITVGRFNADLQ